MGDLTPIERAARALHRSRMERQHPKPDAYPWEGLSPRDQKLRMVDVKVVLTAIREPSEEMLKPDTVFSHFTFDADELEDNAYFEPKQMRECWTTMIDTLLAEKG